MEKKIERVLIGVASYSMQYVESLHSCLSQKTGEGDDFLISYDRRGDIARQAFANIVLENKEYSPDDALLLLDADQQHPADMLQRLRAHNLDMVCAHYYARDADQVQSMCFEIGDGLPYKAFEIPPKEGLHELGTTGFGCVLIKKRVLKTIKENTSHDRNMMETDFAFFHKARQFGYKLWLDASIESKHAVTVWLDHETAERLKK